MEPSCSSSRLLPSHKADENWFWGEVKKAHTKNRALPADSDEDYISPRSIIMRPDFPIPWKRAVAMLEKWAARGLYDYGVAADLGWLTPEGEAVEAREVQS